jgi:hypothetical protein
MDEYDLRTRGNEDDAPREVSVRDRFFYVMAMILAAGVAVTMNLARPGGFELWMVIPGAVAAFATSVFLWWTDAFRYRP